MDPIPIPDEAVVEYPEHRALHIGPPAGMTEAECSTVESLVGREGNLPVYADFWRPTPEQLQMLSTGGFIELRQYANAMVMHSMTVHAAETPTAMIDTSGRQIHLEREAEAWDAAIDHVSGQLDMAQSDGAKTENPYRALAEAAGMQTTRWTHAEGQTFRDLYLTEAEPGIVHITTEAIGELLERAGFTRQEASGDA